MKKLKAMKAVYCYNLPETRTILHEVERKLPDEMYLVTAPAAAVAAGIDGLFKIPLDLPAAADGSIDLDEVHVPIIDRIVDVYSPLVRGLGDFRYRYPTSGSSEGLFHLLVKYKTEGIDTIHVLKGEYEGYGAQALNLKMRCMEVDPAADAISGIRPSLWFISNPSARDGNIIPNDFISDLCDAGHRVVLDLAYAGATRPHEFDLGHENIVAVVMSFSKPYGVFRSRIGGFVFSRDAVQTLYGNKWFKDILRLFQALKLAEDIGPFNLHKKYFPLQKDIIAKISRDLGIGLKPSDSFLLAHLRERDTRGLDGSDLELIVPYLRGNCYRFCLTPYFEEREKNL